MKKILLLLVAVVLSSNLMAQMKKAPPKRILVMDSQIMDVPDEPAQFPGGVNAFDKYIKSNLKYPSEAKKEGIEGKVYVRFVIEKNGSVSHVQVVKGLGRGCDEVAANLIKQSPKWKPAQYRNQTVRSRDVVPIEFKLDPKK